jgi:ERCC4-related helicase
MNTQDILNSLRSRGLQSWQAKFVASFLEAGSPPFQLLAAPPGTGKTQACIAIATEIAAQEAKRILVLTPAPLCEEWRTRLGDALSKIPVFFVNRQTYRELEAAVQIGQSPWYARGIYVISQDLAKQSDFAESLTEVTWDLVIVDEAHRLASPQRTSLLKRLVSQGEIQKLLLVTPMPVSALEKRLNPLPNQQSFFPTALSITSWYGELIDWYGTSVERPLVDLKVVPYTRGDDEVQFLSKFLSLMPDPKTTIGASRFLIRLLIQRAASSLFAIEQSLQRLSHRLKITAEEVESLFGKEIMGLTEAAVDLEEVEPKIEQTPLEWTDEQISLMVVEQCLEEIDRVSTDEKLNVVKGLILSIINEQADGLPRICIFSMYNDTVLYLHTATGDIGIPSFKITGAVTFTERQHIVNQFLKKGGLLIGTDGGLSEGIDLKEVTSVIHYDLPPNPMVFEQRCGRFERFGRKTPCKTYMLRDESGVLPFESRLIESATSEHTTGIDGEE